MPALIPIFAGGLFVAASAMAAGLLTLPRVPLPWGVRYMSGAILTSAVVFVLLAAGWGYPAVWMALGALVIACALPRLREVRRMGISPLPPMPWWLRGLFAGYGLLYLIYALAPETQPDAVGYHLGLVREYVRLHGFPRRAEFYELLPHGVEMLFVPAFAIGAHSAAKLVHLSFLFAAVSLPRHIARELGMRDGAACYASAILFMAPVAAVSATSAYTDAALLCCCSTLLYLLSRWDRDRTTPLLALAAVSAGFCYAIKPTFGWAALAALGFVTIRARRAAIAAAFTACAALPILPWMLRSIVLTGNPFAPLLNRWFPNHAFTASLDAGLIESFSAFRPSFSWRSALLDYTVRGGNAGLLGPAFLLLPLMLVALRSKSGRWLATASVLLGAPIVANTGTRFLMPAMVPAAIAMTAVLPAPAAFALVGAQAIGSANAAIDLYDTRHEWRLPPIPLRAALRLEPEGEYLSRSLPEYANSTLIASATNSKARVFALAPIDEAYLDREVLGYWSSARAARFVDLLAVALASRKQPAMLFSWTWPPGACRAIRATAGNDFRLIETKLDPGPLSVTSWKPWKRDESLDIVAPSNGTGAEMLVWPADASFTEISTKTGSGEWRPLHAKLAKRTLALDLRGDVTATIRRSGYSYLLIDTAKGDFAEIGRDMREHPAEWRVTPAGRNGDVWLFYLMP